MTRLCPASESPYHHHPAKDDANRRQAPLEIAWDKTKLLAKRKQASNDNENSKAQTWELPLLATYFLFFHHFHL